MRPMFKPLGKYMRKKRIEAGLTQAELAALMGYTSAQFVSNAERHLSFYPLKKVKKISNRLNINRKELAGLIVKERAKEIRRALGV